MFEIKNFNNWIIDTNGEFGSGASEKIWLVNPTTKEKGLFKFPKVKDEEKNIITGEYWAEKLAEKIGGLLDIRCSRIDMGTYNGRIGSMSYNFVKEDEKFDEGIIFIQSKYPYYSKKNLIDNFSKMPYSVQLIKNSIEKTINFKDFLKVIIFDALIGNSDRHHSNWGIITNVNGNKYLSPLYDNGSSLCSYEDENNVEVFFKDKLKYEALINTKSKSAIGWKEKRPIRHFELIQNIKDTYYKETIEFVEIIKDRINEMSVNEILSNFENAMINESMKKLLLMFIMERKNRILKIYGEM